jgi:hypothetical protein
MMQTTFGKLSNLMKINRSIVQGSGIDPTLFIMFACDLKPIGSSNYLPKYADDSALNCHEKSAFSVADEMANVDGLLKIS